MLKFGDVTFDGGIDDDDNDDDDDGKNDDDGDGKEGESSDKSKITSLNGFKTFTLSVDWRIDEFWGDDESDTPSKKVTCCVIVAVVKK